MVIFTGDIHGNIDPLLEFIDEWKLTSGDIIVLLGDVGLNYFGNENGDAAKKRELNKRKVHVLCIHGNHEMRPESIESYRTKQWQGGVVYEETAYPYLHFAKDGEVYDLEGRMAIAIGGAYSVDKQYRLNTHGYWWPDEQPSEEIKMRVEQRLEEMNWRVDLIMSHTCPAKYTPIEAFFPGLNQLDVDHSTEAWLDKIESRLDYDAWYCGHWHINKKIDKMHFLMECREMLR